MNLTTLKTFIRDVPDFPKPGIIFKDITPALKDPSASGYITNVLSVSCYEMVNDEKIRGIVAIESRGFLYGMSIAQNIHTGFIPVRKAGKLPYHKITKSYKLEYGEAIIEIHANDIQRGENYIITDDLLATGGTAGACAELIMEQGGLVAGFCFVVELDDLKGREHLLQYSDNIVSMLHY